jgi:hypothetical protein
VTAIALILIASFASPSLDPTSIENPSQRAKAEKQYRLLYVVLAGVLAIFVVAHYGGVRILSALGIATEPLLDTVLTGIVLVGGSDRIAAVLKFPGVTGAERPAPPPIQITGRVTLEDGTTTRTGERDR